MALWQSSKITDIRIGTVPNDGTGDNIRDAFTKVDDNFSNVSSFLSGTQVGFLNADVTTNLTSNYATFANTFTGNATGTIANFTANITAGNLIANTGFYAKGPSNFASNLYISGNILPTSSGMYDLGSAANPFRNFYYINAISGGTVTTSDAGLLVIHANALVGDVKDVGIQGNISHHYNSNTYAFFGYQYQTNNFVYKITPTNASLGNSVVYDGLYGNVQFGSAFLSNSTVSNSTTTGALIVGGGAGIVGNLNVGGNTVIAANAIVAGNATVTGNIYSSGYQVITSGTIGYYGTPFLGGIISGSARFNSAEASTSNSTGAVAIPFGGLGVAGNVVSLSGFYGNLNGNVVTAAQPYITSVGLLNGLNINSGYSISTPDLQATTIGVTAITASTLNVTGALIGLTSLTLNGNVTSNTAGFVGSLYGTVQQPAQPQITSLGALTSFAVNGGTRLGVTTANSFSTANAVITGGYITGLANASATTAQFTNLSSANAMIAVGNVQSLVATNLSSGNAVITGGYVTGLANASATAGSIGTLVATNFSSGNAVITGGYVSGMSNVAATAGSIGTLVATNFSSGNAVITNASATNANIGTVYAGTVNAATLGNTGAVLTGTLSTAAQPNVTSVGTLAGLTVSATANVGISTSANILLSSTGTGIIVTGNILPSANLTYNLGSTSQWFNTFYGVSSQAKYADLAENYEADKNYEPGTVVVFGGEKEITVSGKFADARVAGAISTNPAYLMNATETGLPVALRGRIPVKVWGPVYKGDSLVTAGMVGLATSVGTDTKYGQAVFAKSIETNTAPGEKVITAVIL
jgi:trimeric autotransporter adhesin